MLRVHIGRPTDLPLLPVWHLVAKNDNFRFHISRSTGRFNPHKIPLWDIYYGMYLAAILDSSRKGGNFLLFLNNLSSKQPVSIVESCQMEHPFHMPQITPKDFNSDNQYLTSLTCNMDVRVHIDTSSGRSPPPYWHLVAKNGNFRFHISRSTGRFNPPKFHYGIYITGCIWQPFWILQEKVGIFFYFWIIWVVNSQSAL